MYCQIHQTNGFLSLSPYFTVYFFYWAQPINTDGYGLENDMRGKRKKIRNPSTPFYLSSPSSLHSLPSNHLALIHDSSAYRCLCSLFLFPSLLVAFCHWFDVKFHLLSSVSAPQVLLKAAADRVREEERKGRRERETSCDMATHGAKPFEQSYRGKCTMYRWWTCAGRLNKSLQSFLPQIRQSLFILPFLRVLHL